MRLVDVHTTGDLPIDIALHPRFTVVSGDPASCARLGESLTRAFTLAGTEVDGSVEYGGFNTALDQIAVVSLDLKGDGCRVMTTEDLPEPDTSAHAAALAELLDRRDVAIEELDQASNALEMIRRRAEATGAAARVGGEDLDRCAETIAALQSELMEREAELSKAERHLELLRYDLTEAESRLQRCDALLPNVLQVLGPSQQRVRELRMGDEIGEQLDLLAAVVDVGLTDRAMADEVARWLEAVQSGRAPSDPTAQGRVEEVADLERRWEAISSVGVEDDPDVIAARSHHSDLEDRLAALEELSDSGILADRARDEIDAAHARRMEVEGDRRSRGDDVEDALAQEHRITSGYGFESYLDYTIARSTRSVGEAVDAALDRVRAEVVGARDALEAVRGQAAAVRHALAEERKAARERLREVLGDDADALSVEVLERIPELPGLLTEFEAACVTGRDDLRQEVSSVQSEVADREQEHVALGRYREDLGARIAEEHRRVATLEPLVAEACRQHDVAKSELERAEFAHAGEAAEIGVIERQMAALGAVQDGGYRAADIAAMVSALAPLIDPPDPDPLPLVMIDAFRDMGPWATEILSAVMASAVRVQLIYITEDPSVVAWARKLEPTAGQYARLSRPRWFNRRLARRAPRKMSPHRQ